MSVPTESRQQSHQSEGLIFMSREVKNLQGLASTDKYTDYYFKLYSLSSSRTSFVYQRRSRARS